MRVSVGLLVHVALTARHTLVGQQRLPPRRRLGGGRLSGLDPGRPPLRLLAARTPPPAPPSRPPLTSPLPPPSFPCSLSRRRASCSACRTVCAAPRATSPAWSSSRSSPPPRTPPPPPTPPPPSVRANFTLGPLIGSWPLSAPAHAHPRRLPGEPLFLTAVAQYLALTTVFWVAGRVLAKELWAGVDAWDGASSVTVGTASLAVETGSDPRS